jgi:lipoprotein-anchoring transpeptidase ErfK/SrfK
MSTNTIRPQGPPAALDSRQKQHHPLRTSLLVLPLLFLLNTCGFIPHQSTLSNLPTSPLPQTSLSSFTQQQQGKALLQTYDQWIQLLKQSGGSDTPYYQTYTLDEQALTQANTQVSYDRALTNLKTQVSSIQIPALKTEARHLQQQFQQQVASWGQTHTFHNPYDGINYPLGYEYGENGIGGWIEDDFSAAQTISDYQQAIENMHIYQTNFQAMQENSNDNTPSNQIHQTDLKLLKQYHKTGKALVISLKEQAMRVYNQGKLVNSFYVTTGRPDRPTPPGVWWVEDKLSPTVFKAGVPPGSPDWYPDTPINYAMQYHSGGYFLHDSWWRDDYGPGTNYPHADSSGDSFSFQGSHGCVNISPGNAAWLYSYVDMNTSVIIY